MARCRAPHPLGSPPGACLGSKASVAPHKAAAKAAHPDVMVGWASAVTAPAAGARVNPATAQTTAKRAAAGVSRAVESPPALAPSSQTQLRSNRRNPL